MYTGVQLHTSLFMSLLYFLLGPHLHLPCCLKHDLCSDCSSDSEGVLQSSKYWITTHVVHGCSAVLFGWMDCRQYCPPNVIGYPQSSLNKPLNVFYIRWKKTPPSDFTYGLFFMLINRIVQVVWIDLFAMQVTCFFLTFHVMYIADLLARKPQLSDARYELELGYQVLV